MYRNNPNLGTQKCLRGNKKDQGDWSIHLRLYRKRRWIVKGVAGHCIRVNFDLRPIIQEVHIAIIHMICYSFDAMLE